MIAGLPLDYAHARVGARLALRPDERVWSLTRSARTVAALLEALRAAPTAADVSGVEARAGLDDIERAFRQQLRLRIAEVARWAPQDWRAALLWTRHLIDLPALVQLLGGEPPAAWMHADPALAELARAAPAQRRTLLSEGELAPLAHALATTATDARADLHAALEAWRREWHRRWPRAAADARAPLERLEGVVAAHLVRFTGLPIDQTIDARGALALRALRWVHRHPGEPVALFAYLIVAAIDLERLRGEFSVRAARVLP